MNAFLAVGIAQWLLFICITSSFVVQDWPFLIFLELIIAIRAFWGLYEVIKISANWFNWISVFAFLMYMSQFIAMLCIYDWSIATKNAHNVVDQHFGLTKVQAVYFVLTTFSTVGFGDIHPDTDLARALISAQLVLCMLMSGFFLVAFISLAMSKLQAKELSHKDRSR